MENEFNFFYKRFKKKPIKRNNQFYNCKSDAVFSPLNFDNDLIFFGYDKPTPPAPPPIQPQPEEHILSVCNTSSGLWDEVFISGLSNHLPPITICNTSSGMWCINTIKDLK